MLQRDYILEVIRRFADVLTLHLRRAVIDADADAIAQVEDAIGGLIDLDGPTALALDGPSLTTMMDLTGIADSTASYVAFALTRLGDAYEAEGSLGLAGLRRSQARCVADAFGVVSDAVPAGLEELARSLG